MAGWRLGPRSYAVLARLEAPGSEGGACSWAVVRRDGAGPRCLLQVWEPRPPEKLLDRLREEFLQRFARAEPLDSGLCRFGFDRDKAWFLQELDGVPLARAWAAADRAGRQRLRAGLGAALAGPGAPRCLAPEVLALGPGRVRAPRVLGPSPWRPEHLLERLDDAVPPPGPGTGPGPWEAAPDLADPAPRPLRGRAREMTYLKSLVLGLAATPPMERVLVLRGEGGLGHDRLADWAAAVAESEGWWPVDLEVDSGEGPGGFLDRLAGDLLAGLEAEFYAARPGTARVLARRMGTFAFLRGARRPVDPDRALEPEETAAALEALAFAQDRHPRLVLLRGLERAAPGVAGLVGDLVQGSCLPWLLVSRDDGRKGAWASRLPALGRATGSATVVLDRLEDAALREVLADLLDPHDLPGPVQERLLAASLGNPGLLRQVLEMAQLQGRLARREGRWTWAPGDGAVPEVGAERVADILRGRLRRLPAPALAVVRCLALADQPLAPETLAGALGLDGDALAEALQAAAGARLARLVEGRARIAGAGVRDLVLEGTSGGAALRCARALLDGLGRAGADPLLAVRLQSFAQDRATALARVLQGVEQAAAGPLEAGRIVQEALHLRPDPLQEAALWEFLARAWGRATVGDGLSAAGPGDRSPRQEAVAALDRALALLAPVPAGWEAAARLHRRKAELERALRLPDAAERSLAAASVLLADHPFHPEQPRLRRARARLQADLGALPEAAAALEEGLALLGQKGELPGHRDRVALLLDLGRIQGERGQFQRAQETLDEVRRLAEHGGDRRTLAATLDALALVRLGQGRPDAAFDGLREAAGLAKALDDPGLLAECRFHQGMLGAWQQALGPALAGLESASRRFHLLGDPIRATQVQAWKAAVLAALGDPGLADLLLAQAASGGDAGLTAAERAERSFLQAEVAGHAGAWGEARRQYGAAANRFGHAGLAWRERLARLRGLQAEAREVAAASGGDARPAWIRLEQAKGPCEGSGSRWLELEWHRAHALLLDGAGPAPAVRVQALGAWEEVLAGARDLRLPALAAEAGLRTARLLEELGERLGGRARIREAWTGFQAWWAEVPEAFGPSFLARPDVSAFRAAAECAGLHNPRPDPALPLPDWNLTQAELPWVPPMPGEP